MSNYDDEFYDSLPYAGYLPTLYMEANQLSGHKSNCADGAGGDCTCGLTPIEWFQGEGEEFIGPIQLFTPEPFVPAPPCCKDFIGCEHCDIPF
jgi:hypothetical protein